MTHPAPARGRVSDALLWIGLFAAPALWSIQQLLGYSVLAHRCFPATVPLDGRSPGGPWVLALVVTIIAIVVSLAAGGVSLRAWRRSSAERAAGNEEASLLEVGEGRTRFMAYGGLLLSGLFLVAVLFSGISLLVLPHCG
jgi:hypothetical protein